MELPGKYLKTVLIWETGRQSKFITERGEKFLQALRLSNFEVSYYTSNLNYTVSWVQLHIFNWLPLHLFGGYSGVSTAEMQNIILVCVHKIMTCNNSLQTSTRVCDFWWPVCTELPSYARQEISLWFNSFVRYQHTSILHTSTELLSVDKSSPPWGWIPWANSTLLQRTFQLITALHQA